MPFWYLKHWIRQKPPTVAAATDQSEFWIFAERATTIASFIASLAAIGGIWSWFFEAEARSTDRAATVAQAASGALAVIEESRGEDVEIGQSEAFRTLMAMKRPVRGIDINDVVLSDVKISEDVSQPVGGLSVFRNSTIDYKIKGRINAGCKNGAFFSSSWTILDRPKFKSKRVCSNGVLILFDVMENGVYVNTRLNSIDRKDVRTKSSDSASTLSEDKDSLQFLDTFFAISSSTLKSSTFEIDSSQVRIYNSNISSSTLIGNSTKIDIGESNLRNTKLTNHIPKSDEVGVWLKLRYQSKYGPSTIDVFGEEAVKIVKVGVFVRNSDIRGADLSNLQAEFLVLDNVCADDRTKLPPGVKLSMCGSKLKAVWDKRSRTCPPVGGTKEIVIDCFPNIADPRYTYQPEAQVSDISSKIVREISEKYRAPVYKTTQYWPIVPEDHINTTRKRLYIGEDRWHHYSSLPDDGAVYVGRKIIADSKP